MKYRNSRAADHDRGCQSIEVWLFYVIIGDDGFSFSHCTRQGPSLTQYDLNQDMIIERGSETGEGAKYPKQFVSRTTQSG